MITKFKIFEETLNDFELPGVPDDAKFKIGDNVRVVRGYDWTDYKDGKLIWDNTIYMLQRYYIRNNIVNDYECEIFDYRDSGFYVVHESQLELVPEYEFTANKYNL
jgi:hypothetical protein